MAIEVDEKGEVKASRVEVPGIIKDDYGNEWTLPADEATYDELLTDPLKLPKKDPKFFYEFIRQDQVVAKSTEGFRLVDRREVGVDSVVSQADIGGPQASYHQVHDLFLMKIPKELADRRYRAAKRIADDAVEQIRHPAELAKAGGQQHKLTEGPEPFEVEASRPDLDSHAEPKGRFKQGL